MNLFFPPDFHFKHPEYFLLLVLLIPIYILFFRTLRYRKQLDVTFHQSFFSKRREALNALFLGLAFTSLVLALMQPEGYMQKEKEPLLTAASLKQPLPVLFLLDTSLSMTTQDASFKKSRLEEAREIISSFMSNLSAFPKAFYTFTDHLQPIIPLTLDDTFMELTLDALSPNLSKDGTDILTTLKELKEKIDTPATIKPRQIIFLSDGEDTTINPNIPAMERIVASLAAEGITFNVIGIGTTEGAPIPDLTYEDNPVISKKNEILLKALTKAGDGQYVDPRHISVLSLTQNMSQQFSQNTYEKLYTATPQVSYIPLFSIFLIFTLIALLRGF